LPVIAAGNRRKLLSVVTELKIVGGDPALDLANTVGDARVPDPLDDYAEFAAWARRVGAIDATVARRLTARASAPAAGRALTEARTLRATVDAVFRALAAGDAPPPDALGRLVQRAGAAVERARAVPGGKGAALVRREGGFALAWDGDHLERPLWPLAVSALDLLRDGPLERLKACEDCPWLFLDTSRNHSRRWCSMEDCGTRVKMRRYRAKPPSADAG
jgi:predicted RNA-binding Zn ribbon-like protein